MERVRVSGAELQDMEEGQDSPESVNVPQSSLSDLCAMIQDLRVKVSVLQTEMRQMQTLNKVRQVAFSVSLLASGAGDTGPFNTDTPLVYGHVISNIGNAYSPNTGYFTAPVKGAYHFEFYVYGSGAAGAWLVKNRQNVCMAYEQQTSGYGKSSNAASLLLEPGDAVCVQLMANTRIHDNQNHHSTFSGHLLFPIPPGGKVLSAELAAVQSLMFFTSLTEQSVKLKEVDTLKLQLQEQSAKLTELQINAVNPIKEQLNVGQVAFSASLVTAGSLTLGPFNTRTPVVFRHVVSNIGNAYNPNTGFFIAPVRGAYHFELYIMGPMDSSPIISGAFLVKNGGSVIAAYERQASGLGSSSSGVTLLLEAGDVAFVHLWETTRIYDDGNHHSTFSGHLLFPV